MREDNRQRQWLEHLPRNTIYEDNWQEHDDLSQGGGHNRITYLLGAVNRPL
ncbi:hypothetical protein D3C79_1091940 [compost metagenome]